MNFLGKFQKRPKVVNFTKSKLFNRKLRKVEIKESNGSEIPDEKFSEIWENPKVHANS